MRRGLGLALVHRLVHAPGGLDRRCPRGPAPSSPCTCPRTGAAPRSAPASDRRPCTRSASLVVDDDYRVAAIHAAYVERVAGFEVRRPGPHRRRGASRSSPKLRPDLVLMDVYLPDGDGLDVVRTLLDRPDATRRHRHHRRPRHRRRCARRCSSAPSTTWSSRSGSRAAERTARRPTGTCAAPGRPAAARQSRPTSTSCSACCASPAATPRRRRRGTRRRPWSWSATPSAQPTRRLGRRGRRERRHQPRHRAAVPDLSRAARRGAAAAELRRHRPARAPLPRSAGARPATSGACDIRRSASGLPPVWQVAQYCRLESAKRHLADGVTAHRAGLAGAAVHRRPASSRPSARWPPGPSARVDARRRARAGSRRTGRSSSSSLRLFGRLERRHPGRVQDLVGVGVADARDVRLVGAARP